MAQDSLEQRLSDLERRHGRTRRLLVDVLSLTAVLSAFLYFRPGGVTTFIVGVGGALVVPVLLNRWFLSDRPPHAIRSEVNRDLALERWSLAVAAVGLAVLVAAVAWFVITGMWNIPSVG